MIRELEPREGRSLAAEIGLLARRLVTPVDYFTGRAASQPLRPDRILIFQRRLATTLGLGSSFRQQHHRYVLITAVRGGGEIGVDTKTYCIKEGQSLLVMPFQTHWYENLPAGEILWFFVTFEHEKDLRLERLRDRGAIGLGADGLASLRDLLRCWSRPRLADTLELRLALWLQSLSQGIKRPPVRAPVAPSSAGEWLMEINRLIYENRECALSIGQIAGKLKVSPSLLRSRFRHVVGRSVGRYIRELRLQYACELLHDTRLQVSEVAVRCGYDSVFSFSRAYRNTYRISPSTYRKKIARPD